MNSTTNHPSILTIKIPFFLLILMLASIAGCSTTNPKNTQRFVMSYLIIDNPARLSEDELATVIKGHRANISRLADEDKILFAGPLFEPLIADGYNGIFLYNVDQAQEAMTLFMTDPAVEAGVFQPEMFFFDASEPLTKIPGYEREDKAIRLADPDIPDQWSGRAYVLAMASPEAVFVQDPSVLINAILTPTDEPADPSMRMLFLDFEDVDHAKAGFACDDIGQWSFFGFYATSNLTRLDE